MKRFLLAVTMTALGATAADAGPLRNLACAVKQRVQARPHVRQAACDVRTVTQAVASVPQRIAEAQPVRSAVVQAAYTTGVVVGTCRGGVCR